MKERIQKVLSDSGIASRRQIEKFIQEKRIFVGDRLAKLGEKISREDQIFLDGKKITLNVKNKLRILALNKPEGFECTRSEKSPKKKIFDLLPPEKNFRWISVGRLDLNTSGLLLLTNNGQVANQLMHPSSMLDREYIARIRGEVEPADIEKLKKGIQIDGDRMKFNDLVEGRITKSHSWFALVIQEGKNREVRKLFQSIDMEVSRLKRTRFGPIFLPSTLRKGDCKELDDQEITSLKNYGTYSGT